MIKLSYALAIYFFGILVFLGQVSAQVKSGPMLAYVEYRTARVWCEIEPGTPICLLYWPEGKEAMQKKIKGNHTRKYGFEIVEFELVGLEFGTNYHYQLYCLPKQKPGQYKGQFQTMDLWNFRKQAPDFSFLMGSCNFTNEAVHDRPGKPFGGDSSIFETMAKEKANFMLWLGDNWYYREVDFLSEWGLWYRASYERSRPHLQSFLKSMSHYAIWDDHDYGANNDNHSFPFKSASRELFQTYWSNPGKHSGNPVVYTKLNHYDVDIFLMDGRSYRNDDKNVSVKDGLLNPSKCLLGTQQMQWLKDALLSSITPFKIIALGSQVLNQLSPFDCLYNYPFEFNELMQFIATHRIEGVLFVSGDRHHSEIIGYPIPGAYTTYDITSSPLTAGVAKARNNEVNNPNRVAGSLIEVQNYARMSVVGPPKDRKLQVEFKDKQGKTLFNYSIHQSALKFPN